MGFQDDPNAIQWRIYVRASAEKVYAFLSTGEGRARFWAERAVEVDGYIHFEFPGGQTWSGKIIQAEPNHLFSVIYYGGSLTTFELIPAPDGGTEILLTDRGVDPRDRCEVTAGWVSVLLALKAAVDYSVDLRNHDPLRSWEQGYAEN